MSRKSGSGGQRSGTNIQLTLLGFEPEDDDEPTAVEESPSDRPQKPVAPSGMFGSPNSQPTPTSKPKQGGGARTNVLQHPLRKPVQEPVPDLTNKRVVVIDAHSLIYQVFHALPAMTSGSGMPVSAVYGFVGDVLELIQRKAPDYIIAAFDKSEVTFRNDIYEQYKAHRDPMPDDLRSQLSLIRHATDAMGVGIMEKKGFEADDLLATVAKQVQQAGGTCLIVTSDKDCRQLITDHVSLYHLRKDQELNAAFVLDDWGVRPDQVVDYQSLVGDPVDNVPGVPLIGPKMASQLLQQFGTLECVLDNADSISGQKRKQNLMNGRDQAMLSRQLVRLRDDVDCVIPWSHSEQGGADLPRLLDLFDEFGFRRLKTRAQEVLGEGSCDAVECDWETSYQTVTDTEDLQQLASRLQHLDAIAIDTETTSTSARSCQLVGISVAWGPGQAAYIPIRSPAGEPSLNESLVIETLRPVIESGEIDKIGHNLKFDAVVLRSAGVMMRGKMIDTMVADYLLNPGGRNHTLDDVSQRYLGHTTTKIQELIGTGKNQRRMDEVFLDLVSDYACEDVDVPIRIAPMIHTAVRDASMEELFRDLEMPLVEVLAEMEFNGIRVDVDHLSSMGDRFSDTIDALREEIWSLAGHSFNVDSPRQLADVLFKEMGLPVQKRTRTGISTDAEVLAQLAPDHELPAKVLQYRQATKLKGTYIDALPKLVCPTTNRVHTSLRQDVAATGRLSSSDPNLQNIPIRTEEGRAIRAAFTAGEPEWVLVGADYSQIELRVLAHCSEDPSLMAAYHDDADIHTRVAAEVHGVGEDEVTKEMRRVAKTINFGIVYGQSPFGLSKTLDISRDEARDYIEKYFQRYSRVEEFMMRTLAECRDTGHVTTILGRKREIRGIRDVSKLSPQKRRSLTEAERMAINTPIQGSAADLIKLAMIAVHRRLQDSHLRARMLLQIHDELLFEVDPAHVGPLCDLVKEEMTGVMDLAVPLKVDIATGRTWAET